MDDTEKRFIVCYIPAETGELANEHMHTIEEVFEVLNRIWESRTR